MKFSAKKLAVVSAFALLSAFALPATASAAQVSVPEISQSCVFSSTDDAAVQMRKYIKERTSDFEINIDASVASKETVGQLMIFFLVAAVLGIVARKPFLGVKEFMQEKMKETEVM